MMMIMISGFELHELIAKSLDFGLELSYLLASLVLIHMDFVLYVSRSVRVS